MTSPLVCPMLVLIPVAVITVNAYKPLLSNCTVRPFTKSLSAMKTVLADTHTLELKDPCVERIISELNLRAIRRLKEIPYKCPILFKQ